MNDMKDIKETSQMNYEQEIERMRNELDKLGVYTGYLDELTRREYIKCSNAQDNWGFNIHDSISRDDLVKELLALDNNYQIEMGTYYDEDCYSYVKISAFVEVPLSLEQKYYDIYTLYNVHVKYLKAPKVGDSITPQIMQFLEEKGYFNS